MNRKHITAIMALSLAAVGCGGSGGGGGGSTAGAITNPNGPLSSALPAAQRDPSGYAFQTVGLNSVKGAGLVTAIGEAPTGTQALVAHAPLNELERQDGALVVTEDSFFDKVDSIASVQSTGNGVAVYAGTYSVTSAGSGDIFQRTQLSSTSAQWSIALDTDKSEARVAVVSSSNVLHALVGGEGQVGEIYQLLGGQFSSIATLGSAIPMAAVEYKGLTYIGAMGNGVGGGAARLYRMLGGAVEEVNFPASAGGSNIRQEVVGMASISGVISPSVAPTQSGSVAPTGSAQQVDLLVVAVGSFDRLSHAGMSGQLLVHDGKDWETVITFMGEAPTSLAFIDQSLYVGTSGGKLLFRDKDGKWVEEPSLPANDGVTALLARDQATLLVGLRGKTGAQLAIRTAIGGGVGGPSPYFLPDVSAILANRCVACHSGSAMPAAVAVYSLTATATADADYTSTQAEINLASPAQSGLYVKGSGGNGHVGGNAFQGNEAQVILDWITAGAPKQAAVAPPPPPPPPPAAGLKYVNDVRPILLAKGCAASGCHGNNPARVYQLSLNLTNNNADWTATRNECNPAVPAQSRLLLKANGQSHPVNLIAPGSVEYNTIVQWINDGRQFQ